MKRTSDVSGCLLLLLALLLSGASGFHNLISQRLPTQLSLAANEDYSSLEGGKGPWSTTNDFPQLLNQCSIQTFMSVLGTLRDPHTVKWVDKFTQPVIRETIPEQSLEAQQPESKTSSSPKGIPHPSKLLSYHGLGAMNTTRFPTWESYFATLLEQPNEEYLIQSAAGGLNVKDYEMEINPASLCTRLISIREQIAEELAHDLGVVAESMGQHTMDSYYDYMDNVAEEDTAMPTYNNGQRRLPPHNLVFLGYALDPFDGFTPSPLRMGNFDLAVLLATQESIHRVLNSQGDAANDPTIHFLQDFYVQRMDSHFSGSQVYGRADDFLEELLFSAPKRIGESMALVDPTRVAERILSERQQVAMEWQTRSKDIPTKDHIQIKRLQLDRLMESYG